MAKSCGRLSTVRGRYLGVYMAVQGTLYVTLTDPIVDGICTMVSNLFSTHKSLAARYIGLVPTFMAELRATLEADLDKPADAMLLVATIIAGIHEVFYDMDRAAGRQRAALDIHAGPSPEYRGTRELDYQLRQYLMGYARRQGATV